MRDVEYGVQAVWTPDRSEPAAIGARFVATLEGLEPVDPIFRNWGVVDYVNQTYLPLEKVKGEMTAYVAGNVSRDDYDEPDPDLGYTASASNEGTYCARSMTLTVKAGSRFGNRLHLEAGGFMSAADPSILTYPIFKGALLAIIAQWPYPMAARLFRVDYSTTPLTPGAPLFPYSIFHIPWIAYLPAALAGGSAGPPGILTERAPDGGLLLIAAETTLDIANPEHMRRSRAIAEFMIERTPASNKA